MIPSSSCLIRRLKSREIVRLITAATSTAASATASMSVFELPVQASTIAIMNTSETAMKAAISWRRTDEIRNDTGGVLSGVERSG